jgi:hypothetical protein
LGNGRSHKLKNISVLVDSSNHVDVKSVPVLIKYYLLEGVQVQLLEFIDLLREISVLASEHILKVLDRFTLLDRIIAFSADNNNCNFGGAK